MPATPGYYREGPEALVVSLAARGDRDAFTELVRRRQPWLRSLMRRFAGKPELADDLAQRVFLKVWLKIRTLRQPERFGPWLKHIAVNEWIDHQRKHGPEKSRNMDIDTDLLAGGTDATVEGIDLDTALALLPDPVRMCIVLSYHESMTHPEIAEVTGLKLGTVKSHIRRGSDKLRETLRAYGGSP